MKRGDVKNIIFSVIFFLLIGSIFAITDRDVWFDESFSVLHSQQKAADILKPVDVHPPTYYLFLNLWIKVFGIDSIILRFSSLLVGIIAIIYLYKLFKRFCSDDKMWVLVLLLFTLSTNTMYYFTEIRMYAWLITLSIMSFYYMFMMCDIDFTKYKFKYIFSVIMFLLLHYYAIIYVGFQFLYLVIRTKFRFIKKMQLQLAILALFAWFYIIYFTVQKARTDIIFFQPSTWWSVLSTYYHYFFFYFEAAIPTLFTILGIPFIFMILGLLLWSVDKLGDDKLDYILLFMVIILPPFAGMLVNLVVAPVYHHRYFAMGAWVVFILVPLALRKLYEKKKVVAVVIAVFIVILMVFNLFNYFTSQKNDIVNSFNIMRSVGCNSILLHESTMSLEPMLYYFQEHNCNFTEYIYQNLTERQENAIGYDTINRSFYKRGNMDGIDEFYFFEFNHLMDTSAFTCEDFYNMTGIKITRCVRNV